MLICCLPLLYNWIISHVFKLNAPIDTINDRDWARTLVSLYNKDVTWYRRKLNVEEIIVNYRIFPDVPLIGSKGCISYNHMLALRQFAYPIGGKLDDRELQGMILNDMGTSDPTLWNRVSKQQIFQRNMHKSFK